MNKKLHVLTVTFILLGIGVFLSCSGAGFPDGTGGEVPLGQVANHHSCTALPNGLLPIEDILAAKTILRIAYGHTSHGSQLTTGMLELEAYANAGYCDGVNVYSDTPGLFAFSSDGVDGSLPLREDLSGDVGYYPQWVNETERILSTDPDINVIMWSWCGQLSWMSETDVELFYLDPMDSLRASYPGIVFIYMTGHLDGTGESGNLHMRNEQIRNHCEENGLWLYDFADIESYGPDGTYYLNQAANDECDYDSDGDGIRESNWALAWQEAHPGEWFHCSSAHSIALNANRKAYAAWWLWCAIADDWDEIAP